MSSERGYQRHLILQELKLQIVVSYSMWVLELNLSPLQSSLCSRMLSHLSNLLQKMLMSEAEVIDLKFDRVYLEDVGKQKKSDEDCT